jgi:2-polyprenyl-3-methyl-5-hydroxy-6-metoxy-1,4-benzoquinol methylase
MHDPDTATSRDPTVELLLRSQVAYYDARAPDYADASRPGDRPGRGLLPDDLPRALIDDFAPTGDVLDVACGPGNFTRELVRHARSVTAIDASPRMLERAEAETAGAAVRYVEADVWSWQPDTHYDAIFFGFWLSHVPHSAFDLFWSNVRRWLHPGGQVAFVDEDTRGQANDVVRDVAGTPVAQRVLADGTAFDIVKIFWDCGELEQRLHGLGWDVSVRRVGDTFLYGKGAWTGRNM